MSNDAMRLFVEAFATCAEAAVRHHEWKAAGSKGMAVPFHGDFANVPPSSVAALRRWALAARLALRQAEAKP